MIQLITPDDVRFFLLDRTADDNFLLDAVEWKDDEIQKAMTLTVDKYNSTTPMVDCYNTENFPYRYEMLLGTAASLLRIKAINFTRNKLDYTTKDGTTINDKAVAREYIALSKMMMDEFDQRIRQIKVAKNAEDAWGYQPGPGSLIRSFY